jgi:hypothetical protein
MRFGAVAVVGLMFAGLAQAQQAKAPEVIGPIVPVGPVQTTYVIVGAGCPGQLTARQQATEGAAVWTTALGDPSAAAARPHGLGIHVEFAGIRNEVKALELRVSYLPLGLRAMQVSPTMTNTIAAQPQERTKTFDLDRTAAMRIGGDLLVGPAATITRVHLVSATFADGSVWHAPSDDACTVVPNRVMQVATK